ncbi:hypothetical protein RM844_11385 [Streptomyces sp. DSM 44915]|uniref:Uncharacterized protein n=1 Tax=Streptomyces chisholmiae TaxID=3075540 RepID=A0ABU2JPH5_9ACTN|nr:hypothetical protein [Streptomyces sp. DSM 44915]MDT0266894.1 hypothetical protein [Streptomyces sp. DSM 44915]
MNRVDGKIALVTRGSRGIGAAVALRLADEGAATVAHLASPEAAYLTGASICVDGGFTA